MGLMQHIPKGARYTIGLRIENKFLDLLELGYTTYFTSEKEKKRTQIGECIFLLDIIKFLVTIAWDGRCVPHKAYEESAVKLDEIGKMLGGWRKSLDDPERKNRTL